MNADDGAIYEQCVFVTPRGVQCERTVRNPVYPYGQHGAWVSICPQHEAMVARHIETKNMRLREDYERGLTR